MAVLTEGISVVIRRDAIEAKLNGGWQAVLDHAPKRTLCTDGLLASVGFKRPDDVERFIQFLERSGLVFLEDGTAKDISVVDMLTGPTVNTPWLEFLGKAKAGTVSSSWLFEGPRDKGSGTYLQSLSMEVAVPYEWTYEESLTAQHKFIPKLSDAYTAGHAAAERGDYKEAMRWFRKTAVQGSVEAQFSLGLLYFEGRGVQQDYAEAIKWFHRVAEKGHAAAQRNLGLMYLLGHGVEQDYNQAITWYRRAADRGDAVAQCNLGYMYETGQGVAKDFAEAVKWYLKASNKKFSVAQCNLGEMYEKGQGVTLDFVAAYQWYSLAASNENEAEIVKDAVKNRDLIAAMMTDAQIAQAERQARDWVPT